MKFLAASAFAVFLSIQPQISAEAGDRPPNLRVLHAASFHVAGEDTVVYFSSKSDRCDVVLTASAQSNGDNAASFTASRYEASIADGSHAQHQANNGVIFENVMP